MQKKPRFLFLLLLMPFLLSGCSLLPAEEEIHTAPLLRTVPPLSFETETVQRGDLIKTVKISCKYVPVQSVGLSFPISGEYFDKIFVQAGDHVQAGQLLAQLELGDIEAQIAAIRSAMEEIGMRADNLGRKYQLAHERCEILHQGENDAARAQAFSQLESEYAAQEQSYADQMYLQQLQLSQLEEKLKARQIFAPFEGTITFAKKLADGEKSQARISVITLVDSATTLFRCDTKYWPYFQPGDCHQIEVGGEKLEAIVTDEAALGLEAKEKLPDKSANIYLMLREPNFELEEGDYGYLTLILDQRPNALHVSEAAVSHAGEQAIVYYLRPDGVKAYKPIETGITVGDRVEVISGLDEGEQIIVN